MSDERNPTAPKFASFRPKPALSTPKSSPTDELLNKNKKSGRPEEHSRIHDDRQRRLLPSNEKKAKDRDHRDRHSSRRKTALGTVRDQSPSSVAIDPLRNEPEYYVVDRKGDPANISFGRVHRYSIPPFRRYGYGRVLGLSRNERIDFDTSTEHEIHIKNNNRRHRSARQWATKYKPSNEPRILRLIRPDAEDKHVDSYSDYIALPSTRKRKRGSESPATPNRDPIDYRSIEGKAKAGTLPEDSDLEYESDRSGRNRESELENAEHEIRLRNAALSNRTKETPRDLQAWVELIDHQQDMVILGRQYPSSEPSTPERRNIADIRISIYTQALREVRARQDKVQLVKGLMNEGKHYWESKQLTNRWQETLKEYPDNVGLWTDYLDFAQTNFVDFKYETCRGIFRTCLEMLAQAQAASLADQSWNDLVDIQAYILLRFASLAKEAGYQEHAIAVWQALLEYHMFRPSSPQDAADTRGMLNAFEEFWESEVPRIGEVDAKGWNRFDVVQTPIPEAITLKFRTIAPSLQVFHDFSVLEEEHMNALELPGRSADDTGEDDPFHLILFSDIQEFISVLPQSFPHDILIEAFLCFWHLPPLSFKTLSNHQRWWQDGFLRNEAIKVRTESVLSIISSDGISAANSFSDHSRSFSNFSIDNVQMTTDSLFQNAFKRGHTLKQIEFVRRVLKQIASASMDDRVAEYHLAFELEHSPDSARKSAKQLLKKRPTSLRLYNAYALIEAKNGNSAASDHVFCTALSMVQSLPENAQNDHILLWHTWIWEALDRGDIPAASHRVMSIGTDKPTPRSNSGADASKYSSTARLKIQNILRDGRDYSLSTGQYPSSTLYISCYALLCYLMNDRDIEAALDIYRDATDILSKRDLSTSPAAELNHQAQARLLAYHASQSHSFKPSLIREELAQGVMLFPSNTYLLSVYAANEARFRIDDRVRAIMRDVVLKGARNGDQAPSVVGWAFAIFSEMNRGENLGSTTYSVRATFEKAVESDCGRNSQALWTSYVFFELAQKKPSRMTRAQSKKTRIQSSELEDRAKRVFLRGLTRLPWCKPYMMLAFSHLKEMLTFEELRKVYSVLGEKELRVHVDLEEAFAAVEEARTENMGFVPHSILSGVADNEED